MLECIGGEGCAGRGGGAASRPCPIIIQHLRGSGADRQTDKTQIRHPSIVNDISLLLSITFYKNICNGAN